MKHRTVLIVAAAIVVVSVGAVVLATSTPSERIPNPGERHDPSADINFVGTVSDSAGVTINGTLTVETINMSRDGFPNVSYRLYDANGTLLDGRCVGTLVEGERTSLDVTHAVRPKYVVFSSPAFWPGEGEEYLTMASYYEYREDQYVIRLASRPSSYPIDIQRHDPCS